MFATAAIWWQPDEAVTLAGFVVLGAVVIGRLYPLLHRAQRALDGPVSTHLLTAEERGGAMPGRRFVVHLRTDGGSTADMSVMYSRPLAFSAVSNVEATVYGSVEPRATGIAVTSSGFFVGRFR